MLRFKKLLLLATCSMLTTSIALTGCGSEKSASANEGETVKLTWYTIGQTPKDLELVEDKANEYLKEKINATIDMKFIDYGEYTQKMGVIINSGEPYDLAFTCSWANPYLENARKGAFLEIDDLIESEGQNMKKVIDQRFWDGAKIDGKTYAVPNQKEIGVAPMWVFTKEYVDKYNIPYEEIHSLKDLEPWLKVIKEKEPDVTPLYITKGFSAPAYFDQLVDPLGVEYDDENLTIKNMFETDKMKEELNTLQDFYNKGYINKDAATAKDDKSVKRLVTKADGQPYADGLWSKDLGYDVVSSPIMKTHITNGSTTGSMIAISKTSENPEKAMEFLNLLNTDVYLRNLLNYGIEGTHYEKTGDTQIKLTSKAKDYSVGYYTLGNLFLTYTLDTEPVDKWKEFEAFNNDSVQSPALGFKFNTEKVSSQIAAINNVLEEFKSAIYSGSVNESEYLDKMNKKLKEVGLDDVQKEMQSQIDDWKAENKK